MRAIHVKVALLLLAGLASAGCWRKQAALTVGSKTGTEQRILGEMVAQHLEHRLGKPVVRRADIGGTEVLHASLLAGEIDMYPEYTGTALRVVLKQMLVSNEPEVVWDRVRDAYRNDFNLHWMPRLGVNSAYTVALTAEEAGKRNLSRVSDAEANRDGWVLAYSGDFGNRPDGLPLLTASYRLQYRGAPMLMEQDQLYRALNTRAADMIVVRVTDGPLTEGNYKVLEDDRQAFPPYEAAVVVRDAALRAHPEAGNALRELGGKISVESMRRMNAAVELRGRSAADVAADFLRGAGLAR